MCLDGPDRPHPAALGLDEVDVLVHPALVATGVELLDQDLPCILSFVAPCREQRLQGVPVVGRQLALVGLGRLDQHVEVAHRPKVSRDIPEATLVTRSPLVVEGVAEDSPRRALPAGRDAHAMELLVPRALPGARLARDHAREVEPEDLSPRLREMVVREDPGRLAGRQPPLLGRLAAVVLVCGCIRALHRVERSLELRCADGLEVAGSREHRSQRAEDGLVAIAQLRLELREPVDELAAGDDLDLVERELDDGSIPPVQPLAAQLAQDDELLEDAVAGKRDDLVARGALRPHRGRLRGIGWSHELVSLVQGAAVVLTREALERDQRSRRRSPQSRCIPGRGEGRVGCVEVAILVVDVVRGSERLEPAELVRGQQSRPRGDIIDQVLELDLERSRGEALGHARGSIDPAPTPGPRVRSVSAAAVAASSLSTANVSMVPSRDCRTSVRIHVPSGSSCHERRSSASITSMIRESRAWASGSSTGVTTSTRRSRLRSMMSADPMYHSGRPALPNIQIRECSRNSPTIERTRIVSDTSGRPGRRHIAPRTMQSIWTPALDASYSASITCTSTSELTLMTMRAGAPPRARTASRSMSSRIRGRSVIGATRSLRNTRWRERPVSTLNRSVTSAPSSSRHDSRPRSTYSRAVLEL